MRGEGAVTDGTCLKWFANFCAGDFPVDHAPWLGRPAEVDSNQIEILIENNRHPTMWETADMLKISKSIKLLMKMNSVFYFTETPKQTFWPTQNVK